MTLWDTTHRFAGGGLVLGAALGLMGFLMLEHPGWLGLWAALFLGLGWAGWDVRLRQVGKLAPARPWRPQPTRLVKDGPFVMVELAGGTFMMGSAATDDMARKNERPQHQVTVSGFRIGRTPVSQGEWREVPVATRRVYARLGALLDFVPPSHLPLDVQGVKATVYPCSEFLTRPIVPPPGAYIAGRETAANIEWLLSSGHERTSSLRIL